jgi:glycosyltransferase involved in cell wall biosynthesis
MRDRPARVVHLITRLDLGGAQQNTLYCVRHHDRARFEVSLWAGSGGRLDPEAAALADTDVRLLPWLVHPISAWRDALAVGRLASMLSGVDLLHTHSSKAGILGRAAARLAGVPAVVHTVHGWSFNDTQRRAVRSTYVALERWAARSTGRLVCVSEVDRAAGISLGIGDASAYRVLRSGIDAAMYAPAAGARERMRRALDLASDTVLVGSIGNLKAQKAPLDFVEAARRAWEKDRRLRFVYAGDGELRGEVEDAIARGGLGGVVRLLGWRDDVPDLLAALDVFLLTSHFEGLPRAALQAIAAGVPVVATDTGGIAEIVVPGESGVLVRVGDTAAAAAAVLRLAADPELGRGLASAARARLDAGFDIRSMLRDLEAEYEALLPATVPSHLGGRTASH